MLFSLGVTVTDDQRKTIYDHYDFNTDGLLKFNELNELLVEILMGHIFFSSSLKDRLLRDVSHNPQYSSLFLNF